MLFWLLTIIQFNAVWYFLFCSWYVPRLLFLKKFVCNNANPFQPVTLKFYTPNMNIGSANVSTYICFKLMDAWGKMDFFYCKVSICHIICQCHLGPYVISRLERHLLVDLLHVRKTLNTFNRSFLWFKLCNIFDRYIVLSAMSKLNLLF